MKKYLSFMAFALMAVFSLTLASCGDDDEEELQNGSNSEIDYTLQASGRVVVSDLDGNQLYVSIVKDAGYRIWATDYNMSDATISFKAFISPEDGLNTSKKLTMIALDPPAGESLEVGKISDNGRLSFSYYKYDSKGYIETKSAQNWFTGTVEIVSVEANKTIELKFSECKSEIEPNVVFNGEIKFPIRQKSFFE